MARVDGYVADMEYVHNFCHDLGPSALNFVLTMQGMDPISLNSAFAHCDVGCGQGISTNIFAACHPDGEFHAIDFNNAHILGARELARKAKLENVTFWQAKFDEMGSLDLPEFDFITLHGVYSWISAENRKHIVDFIRCKLKVGGVVYVSYNCLPGWSAVAPIRHLLISCSDMTSNFLEEQINASVEFVGRLKSMNIEYFNKNAFASSFFDDLSGRSRNYLAHEYFNEHWTQFYHSDVVKDFALANMTYIGSARFIDNFDFLRFSVEEQQLLKGIDNSILKETVKDFAVNQQFRKDVFIKGHKQHFQAAQQALVLRCRFALVVPIESETITLNFSRVELHLAPELYNPVLYALNQQQQSLEELLLMPAISGVGSEKTYQVLMVLLSAGYIMPAVNPSSHAIVSARLFNYAILELMALNMEPQYLVSPVVQSGIQLSWVQRLLLLCELTDSGDPLSFVSSMMLEHNYALIKDGTALLSWDDNLEELGQQVRLFQTSQLPLLKRLGVI